MNNRVFWSLDGKLDVQVMKMALTSMFANCERSARRETGGILIGRYGNSGTTVTVLEALSPPVDSVSTESSFQRGTSGLAEELESRWETSGSHYVGEWHFHPLGNGTPSHRDQCQMIDFARDPGMQCSSPVLIVAYPSIGDAYQVRVLVFSKGGYSLALDLEADLGETRQ